MNKGCHVFPHNSRNVELTDYLSSKVNLINLKTLRKDRKLNTKEVIARKLNKSKIDIRSRRDVTIKWKHKRDVLMSSNAHKPRMINMSNRHGKVKQKPNMIIDF